MNFKWVIMAISEELNGKLVRCFACINSALNYYGLAFRLQLTSQDVAFYFPVCISNVAVCVCLLGDTHTLKSRKHVTLLAKVQYDTRVIKDRCPNSFRYFANICLVFVYIHANQFGDIY